MKTPLREEQRGNKRIVRVAFAVAFVLLVCAFGFYSSDALRPLMIPCLGLGIVSVCVARMYAGRYRDVEARLRSKNLSKHFS